MDDTQPKITQLAGNLSLKSKECAWKPNPEARTSIVSCGYFIGETIGGGIASKIKRAYCKKLNTTVAIKIIRKNRLSEEIVDKFVVREIKLLQQLQHPGLLDVYDVYESKGNFYIVMEYAPNGDLLSFVNKYGKLGEIDSRRIFRQLLDVVSHLHSHNVCHRDIKCENILLDVNYNIRLIDFGVSRQIPHDHMAKTNCGSFVYTAPEAMDGDQYNVIKADVWSMGVCLYAMLCGRLPFCDDDVDVLRQSFKEKLKFNQHLCKEARQLLRFMLCLEADERANISDIHRSDWMCKPLHSAGDSMSSMSLASVIESLHGGCGYDPYIEHGFTCGQKTSNRKPTCVSNVLRAVAENHSFGKSSVDLTLVMPAKQVSSTALLTGIAGPIGRKISQQLCFADGFNIDTTSRKSMGKAPLETGKVFKPKKTFKIAATAVTASNRFRKNPLNSILRIPQEQGMQKMLGISHSKIDHEVKDLHYADGSKVASMCGSQVRERAAERQLRLVAEKKVQRERIEKRALFFGVFSMVATDDGQSREQSDTEFEDCCEIGMQYK